MRDLSYSALGDTIDRSMLSQVERAATGLTVEKLYELAIGLDFGIVPILALCVALERGTNPGEVLIAASAEIEAFVAAGGLEILQQQMNGEQLARRSPGKPLKAQNLKAVQELKAQGKTQAEVVRALGLAQSTVQRYWHTSMG